MRENTAEPVHSVWAGELKGLVETKTWLLVEFVILFIGFPLAFHFLFRSFSPLPFLGLFSAAALIYLLKSADFTNRNLFNFKGLAPQLPRIMIIFVISIIIMFLYIYYRCPKYLLYCPRRHTQVWLTILWSYPLLDVYPQEVIYRAFLFRRYADLFKTETRLIHISAAAFSFGHIIYYNPYSMILTLFGGYLFAYTYRKSNSLAAASLEHALYGCLLYTIGLGRFIFTGIDKILG